MIKPLNVKKTQSEDFPSNLDSANIDGTIPSAAKGKNKVIFIINKLKMPKMIGKKRHSKIISKRNKKIVQVLGGLFAVFLFVHAVLFFDLFTRTKAFEVQAKMLKTKVEEQNIAGIKKELIRTTDKLDQLRKSYKRIAWMKYYPYFGSFVKDGEHGLNALAEGFSLANIIVEVFEPYSDIVGFLGDGGGSGNTTQDRIDFVVKTIPDIIPRLGEIASHTEIIQNELSEINPQKYPETFAGRQIRDNLIQGLATVDTITEFVKNGQPILEQVPYLLGAEEERKYIIIFQNNKELRPTGGFITAYTIAKVKNGKFEPDESNDIYNLDSLYTPEIPAPDPIIKYLKGPYLISENYRLRDMNWDVDFSQSMKLFTEEIKKVGIDDIDGVIAVDTQVLVNIIDVIGEIQVPGFGGYSNNIVELCDCEQIIYELEHFADIEGPIVWSENEPGKIVYAPANYEDRKKIIGPMMNTVITQVLGMGTTKLPFLFNALLTSINEKHILMYAVDDKVQDAIKTFGMGGTVDGYSGDYLYINDANLGGRKANLYVTQEIEQDIEIDDGSVVKTVSITYKNPKPQNNWLNSVLPNYVRIYVPKGSELIAFNGVDDKKDPYEEFGKTVFAGHLEVRPLGVSQITLKFKLPFKIEDDKYNLLIQKQPGKKDSIYTTIVGNKIKETLLNEDTELHFDI